MGINKPLLPTVCDYSTANLSARSDYSKTWDFFPEKKIEFLVKGFSHLSNTYQILRSISKVEEFFPIGTTHKILLKKEPANPYDSNAIAVWLTREPDKNNLAYREDKLGYIPKWLTTTIHNEWDRIGAGYIYQVLNLSDGLTACRVVMGYDGYQVENLTDVAISARFDNLLD